MSFRPIAGGTKTLSYSAAANTSGNTNASARTSPKQTSLQSPKVVQTFSWKFFDDGSSNMKPILEELTKLFQSKKYNSNGDFALVKTKVEGLFVVTRNDKQLDPNVSKFIGWTKPVSPDMLSRGSKGVNSISNNLLSQSNEFLVLDVEETPGNWFPYNFTFMKFYNN